MKKMVFITIMFVLSNTLVYAQDKEPDKMVFNNPKSSSTFVFDITQPEFQQSSFILGWQWAGHLRISESLKMNKNFSFSLYWDLLT